MPPHSRRKHSHLLLSREEFQHIAPGTIRIDCSGAYIANDHLLRRDSGLLSLPPVSPSPPESASSSSSSPSDSASSSSPSPSASAASSSPSSDSEADTASTPSSTPLGPVSTNITLPRHDTEIIHFSVDIGGTLTKLVYFSKSAHGSGGRLHFRDFQTGHFANEALLFMIKLIKSSTSDQSQSPPITYIMATGGGAHKFYHLMKSTFRHHNLPMKIIAADEMECLIRGLDWLITKIPQELFVYNLTENNTCLLPNVIQNPQDVYPYLLVNIGSGVSMIKVTGPGPHGFERIGGLSLGGGTLWGLLSLLTEAKDYNEMLEMALRGNNDNIDLLVGDIYGSNYNKIGLKLSHIALSFAKVFKKLHFGAKSAKPMLSAEKLAHFKQEDIARLLLYLISNNIGQISYLQAVRFGLKRIYFGGSYISGHLQTIHTLSFAVNFWSGGEMQSYFLRHEGYLGSVGAFLMGPDSEG